MCADPQLYAHSWVGGAKVQSSLENHSQTPLASTPCKGKAPDLNGMRVLCKFTIWCVASYKKRKLREKVLSFPGPRGCIRNTISDQVLSFHLPAPARHRTACTWKRNCSFNGTSCEAEALKWCKVIEMQGTSL